MWLRKRKCDVAMRLVPYGAGWTDVYLTIGGDEHYFIISNVVGDQFSDLLSILYRLHPDHRSEETMWDCIEYKVACAENGISGPSKIADSTKVVNFDTTSPPYSKGGEVCVKGGELIPQGGVMSFFT